MRCLCLAHCTLHEYQQPVLRVVNGLEQSQYTCYLGTETHHHHQQYIRIQRGNETSLRRRHEWDRTLGGFVSFIGFRLAHLIWIYFNGFIWFQRFFFSAQNTLRIVTTPLTESWDDYYYYYYFFFWSNATTCSYELSWFPSWLWR